MRIVSACGAILMLAACASGGSGGVRATATPPAPAAQESAQAPVDPQEQYDLGLAAAGRGDYAAAARAFDACSEANPRFAYAYYQAGLAYEKLNRPDLTAIRFETFLRVAPDAPERPQVESILKTMRGR